MATAVWRSLPVHGNAALPAPQLAQTLQIARVAASQKLHCPRQLAAC